MKKSQILAAFALAMALGVVAPIASVSAADTPANQTESNDVTAMTTAINKVKNSFQLITVYDASGNATTKTGAHAYNEYNAANNGIKNARKLATDTREATGAGSIAAAILNDVDTAMNLTYNGEKAATMLGTAYTDIKTSATKWTGADFEQAYRTLDEVKSLVDAELIVQHANDNQDKIKALENTIAALNVLINNKQNRLDAAIMAADAGETTTLAAQYKKFTNKNIVIDTEAKIAAVTAELEGKLPDITLFRDTLKPIKDLLDAIDNINSTDHDHVVELIRALENASKAAGTNRPGVIDTPTTNTPANNGTNNANNNTNAAANTATDAPNTGALSTAEGTATTVSIVAGLATALTALGAGVVAYRNARRSE